MAIKHPIALLSVACLIGLSSTSPIHQQSMNHEESSELDPYPALGKPRLTFRPDGTFKVTVFSDLHFGENPWDEWGPQQDAKSLRLMNTVLSDERPDYAVINGDLVTGENTFKENATTLIDQIVGPFNEAKVPFSTTHGNHDNQHNITHHEEILREQKMAPLSYTRLAPKGVGGAEGPGNYWVPVYKSISDSTPALILWFFDSRANQFLKYTYRGIGGFKANPDATTTTPVPDWVDESVASWIREEARRMEATWGSSSKRGALAFMHIPPHAAQNLQTKVDSTKNPGLNEDTLGKGSVQASVDSSSVGKDEPFWNTLTSEIKNLHAIISGHAHGNEWCARDSSKNVVFCFNKHSGYGGYGKEGWGYGVRNMVFKSSDPKVAPETWIRLEEGETRARVVLNEEYDRDL